MGPNRGLARQDVRQMFAEMVEWLARQQVSDDASPYHGCIFYPTENRYCNRDTACAAAMFMRQYHVTGDVLWKDKAALARDYVLRAQRQNGGYPELRGMEDSDGGSAVNTSIIADNLIHACALGLDYGSRDVRALERMADFELGLEWKPGAFYHDTNHLKADPAEHKRWGDEGSKRDCQNTTALSAMMLQRIYHFLKENGVDTKEEWLSAAARGVRHLIECQAESGHWHYYATGADWFDMNHHGMVMFHLAEVCEFPPHKDNRKAADALIRGGRWLVRQGLLHTEKGSKIDWAIQKSACLYFTWGFFVTSAPLCRLAKLDPESREFWQTEALELLRYVRTDLWHNPECEKEGPFRLTEAGMAPGYAWFGQSLGWCLYQLDDLINQMGWWDK